MNRAWIFLVFCVIVAGALIGLVANTIITINHTYSRAEEAIARLDRFEEELEQIVGALERVRASQQELLLRGALYRIEGAGHGKAQDRVE